MVLLPTLLTTQHGSDSAPIAQADGRASVPGAVCDAVIDTNVALDWLLFGNPRVDALMRSVQAGRLRWIACAAMRDELARMLAHRKLQAWAPDPPQALARFDALAAPMPAPAASRLLRCSDADDQVFVDLALAQGAAWLFTHDRALLTLARRAQRHGLSIARPQHWPDARE